MKHWFLNCCLTCFACVVHAQHPPAVEQQLERLADATGAESRPDDEYLAQLNEYLEHPLAINTATREQLQGLHLLTDLQIDQLVAYRKLAGPLIDLMELQAVPGWDIPVIEQLRPYLVIGSADPLPRSLAARLKGGYLVRFRAGRVLERAKGYDQSLPSHYLGSPAHLGISFRYQYKDLLQYGWTADKDAGEQFFRGAQRAGFDFYSAHLFLRRIGIIKAIALGDFSVNLGQGLICWQSFGAGKSADVMNIKRQGPVLLPYRSAGEYAFERGVGATFQWRHTEASIFASSKRLAASPDSNEAVGALISSGYFRTPLEISKKGQVRERMAGGNLCWLSGATRIGVNWVVRHWSSSLLKGDEPYQLFAFSGNEQINGSLDYSCTIKNVHFFGEAAVDKDLHRAVIAGALLSVDPKLDLSILYRCIDRAYRAAAGNAFTENSMVNNEEGIYIGIGTRFSGPWQLSAYADLFCFPWLRYRVHAPTQGFDYLLQWNFTPDRHTNLYIRYRNRNKPVNSKDLAPIEHPEDDLKRELRLHISTEPDRDWTVSCRADLLWLSRRGSGAEQGVLGFVEMHRRVGRKIRAGTRLQYFESGSYDTRIYVFESDGQNNSSIPAFYGSGFYYYIQLQYKVNQHISGGMHWAQAVYKDGRHPGSGLDELPGNKKSEFQVFLQLSFGSI